VSAANPPIRPEFERTPEPARAVVRDGPSHRLSASGAIRKTLIVVVLAILWEIAARIADNDLLLPPFSQVAKALVADFASGELVERTAVSLGLLVEGYAIGIVVAFLLTGLAISSRIGRDLLSTLTSMLNPLPAIALLPLALLWFGLGRTSLLFVLVHSVLWPLALSMFAGFQAVPETLRMAGRNYGLRGLRYTALILVPSALPAILSGLRVGWAFAWRTLIAAELFFGASSGRGGLGWYIFQNRNELYTDRVFAGLVTVIAIGMLVENLVFETIERVTVRRWGVQR
jgi:NitT/TauT family transport system permease protein